MDTFSNANTSNSTRVVFLLTPQLHQLDLAGPAEVFHAARDFELPYEIGYVAEQPEVPTAEGLTMLAPVTWPALGPGDLLVVPGREVDKLTDHEVSAETSDRIRDHHERGGLVAGVGGGVNVLARAGLLDGRRSTTHHQLQDQLADEYPETKVVRDVLYVVDGRIATSAGIASGIDLALHLVALRHGPGAAAKIARALVVHTRRNGHEQQTSVLLQHRQHLNEMVHNLQDLIENRFGEALRLTELAATLGHSARTITRHFYRETGLTPLRYQQLLRLEHANHLIAQGSTMGAAARAVGLADARALRALRSKQGVTQPPPDFAEI